jgi:hypothetical protein
VAFSPDGKELATASSCGCLRIRALDIGDLLQIAHREVPRLTGEERQQYLSTASAHGRERDVFSRIRALGPEVRTSRPIVTIPFRGGRERP